MHTAVCGHVCVSWAELLGTSKLVLIQMLQHSIASIVACAQRVCMHLGWQSNDPVIFSYTQQSSNSDMLHPLYCVCVTGT